MSNNKRRGASNNNNNNENPFALFENHKKAKLEKGLHRKVSEYSSRVKQIISSIQQSPNILDPGFRLSRKKANELLSLRDDLYECVPSFAIALRKGDYAVLRIKSECLKRIGLVGAADQQQQIMLSTLLPLFCESYAFSNVNTLDVLTIVEKNSPTKTSIFEAICCLPESSSSSLEQFYEEGESLIFRPVNSTTRLSVPPLEIASDNVEILTFKSLWSVKEMLDRMKSERSAKQKAEYLSRFIGVILANISTRDNQFAMGQSLSNSLILSYYKSKRKTLLNSGNKKQKTSDEEAMLPMWTGMPVNYFAAPPFFPAIREQTLTHGPILNVRNVDSKSTLPSSKLDSAPETNK